MFDIKLTMTKGVIMVVVFATVTAYLCAPADAQGTLEVATDPAFGPNSLVIDTSTGLTWLNLTHTVGLSANQGLAGMESGGEFAGFTYATSGQVATLFADGTPGNNDYSVSSLSIATFISVVGNTGNLDEYPACFGEVYSSDASEVVGTELLGVEGFDGAFRYTFGEGPSEGIAYSADFGNWLIAVPEPEVWHLVLVGGLLIVPVMKKRRVSL